MLEQMGLPLEQGPPTLEHADFVRMGKQRTTVLAYMAAGRWWTLAALAEVTGYPEASVSARLRDFRKAKHGGHTVERRRVGWQRGLWTYRLTLNSPSQPPTPYAAGNGEVER